MFGNMSSGFLVVAVVLGVILWLVLMTAAVFLVSKLLPRGPGAGWKALTERFGTEQPPMGNPLFHGESVKVGRVVAKRCALVGVDPRGLYLKCPWRKAVLIPWTAFTSQEPAMLYWGHALRLTVGSPPIASITVRAAVADAIHPYLATSTDVPRVSSGRPRVVSTV